MECAERHFGEELTGLDVYSFREYNAQTADKE